ncbi:HAMP domain-containing sensor histidine kinase [Frigidibacter sp. MR17.14]|uniref:sensor histidine kinase n=1 Tax=Frigidibacter sp. MR17.14 TaxID=3126509 RepID=UPI003012A41D
MSRSRRLWLSTPVRLAAGLVALFVLASLATLAASYAVTRASLAEGLRDDLRAAVAGYSAAPTPGAIGDLVNAEAQATDPRRRIISYLSPDGRRYGNGYLAPGEEGFRLYPLEDLQLENHLPYLAFTARLRGGLLTVAASQSQIEDLGRAYVTLLLVSLLPSVVIAMAGGVWIARRTGRRIDGLGAVLDRIAAGELSARVAGPHRRDDDLTVIGERINDMASAREAATEALRQVSADIAHDLKTPIQRVSVLLERLRGVEGLPEEALALADKAGAETEGIAATFQALLQIAQIEGGSPRARFALVDLAEIARTLGEVYAPSAEDSGHRLDLAIAPGPVRVTGDRALLGQVIANLIENALRHTAPGSRIRLSLAEDAGGARLAVEDDGPGIPEAERGNVLRRLYRLERSRTTPGSGLGLSLVAVIADLHGAELRLEGADPGLRVAIDFPAVKKSSPDAA